MRTCSKLVLITLFLSLSSAKAAKTGQKLTMILPAGESAETVHRSIANEGYQDEALEIRYITVGDNKGDYPTPKVESIDLRTWQSYRDGGRLSYLQKFYYANSRDKSGRGMRHVACFNGPPEQILAKYFDGRVDKNRILNVAAVTGAFSADWGMLSLQFSEVNGKDTKDYFFRMNNCQFAGKGAFIQESERHTSNAIDVNKKTVGRLPAQVPDVDMKDDDASLEEQGFATLDKPEIPAALKGKLPSFELRADYDKATADDRPWKGMDIHSAQEGEKLALRLLAHFYDGMADQDSSNPDNNLIAANQKKRYWCHMPWLNVGPSGREGIHGLTNERPLQANAVFPDSVQGADWGIGYYNAPGCQIIKDIFGTKASVKDKPDFAKGHTFKDGTMSVKTLFTTAKFKSLEGSFEWHANVSEPQSNDRDVKTVRMVQIDIAVKDSSIKGTNPKISNWLMTTFYYDKNYDMMIDAKKLKIDAEIGKQVKNVPASMLKMRPIGVQTGFEAPATDGSFADSMIFSGSKTNQVSGRLNGPADNPKSSCLSCHGTAGTRVFMAPGFMNNEAIEPYRKDMLDYSQQLALAKRNYETRKHKVKE